MGWLDTIGGYPRDDSDEIMEQEAEGIEQCKYLIENVGGIVPEDITAIDCETECPAFKVCQISDKALEGDGQAGHDLPERKR